MWSTPATGLPHSKQAKGNQGGDSRLRSEERRVGKEGRSRGSPDH